MDTLIVANNGKNNPEYMTGHFNGQCWLLLLGGKAEHFNLCAESILRWLGTTGKTPPTNIPDMETFVDGYLRQFRPDILAQLPNQTCRGCFWKVQLLPKGQIFHAVFMHDDESENRIAPGFEVMAQMN